MTFTNWIQILFKFNLMLLKIMQRSIFTKVSLAPPDAILGISEAYKKDSNPKKINLGVGAYRDNDGKPYLLNCVKQAEAQILDANKEYQGILGNPQFIDSSIKLAYGTENLEVAGCQSLSGTGALRVAGEFINRFITKKIYLPTPTWGNHLPIFKTSGLDVGSYKYYDKDSIKLNYEGLVESINSMEKQSVVLLHACAHNPTGVDPSEQQWDELSKLVKSKELVAFFDMAYQGFATGDINKDAYGLRKFVKDGNYVILSQSYAKNMGLYGERIGCLSIVCQSKEEKERVESQLKLIVRPMYSNPPLHGARIVEKVLSDEKLYKMWIGEVKTMANRIIEMRKLLFDNLSKKSSKNWDHITKQIGMFCYTGLNEEQSSLLTTKYHVYLTKDGRISMAGVSSNNVEYLANAIHEVTK